MSAYIRMIFFLVGALAGKTIKLGKYSFVNGSVTIEGPAEQVALHARSLERNWGALPEHDPRLKAVKESDNGSGDLSPGGEGPEGSAPADGDGGPDGQGAPAGGEAPVGGGDGGAVAGSGERPADGSGSEEGLKADPEPRTDDKLKRVVLGLDPKKDDNWTAAGLPAMTAVEKLYGSAGITRADVEAVAPGFTRAQAAEAKAK